MKRLQILRFFGEQAQKEKALEEMDEIRDAFEAYLKTDTKQSIQNVINETNDFLNVIEGLYLNLGGNLEEVKAEKEYKLNRTIQIISDIPKRLSNKEKVRCYDQLRTKYK